MGLEELKRNIGKPGVVHLKMICTLGHDIFCKTELGTV